MTKLFPHVLSGLGKRNGCNAAGLGGMSSRSRTRPSEGVPILPKSSAGRKPWFVRSGKSCALRAQRTGARALFLRLRIPSLPPQRFNPSSRDWK